MKARRSDVERALGRPGDGVRLFLLHGPDTAGSDELARQIAAAAGSDAERISLSAASLKADPALLADEAASLSLFGGSRVIVVEGGGDELLGAVEALLAASAAGNLVVIVAGALKKSSKLLAAVEAAAAAMACASYVPEGREADRLVDDMGKRIGLAISPQVARRVADAGGGDRAVIGHELAKFALFLDAAPERPATLDDDVVGALSAGGEEGDASRLVDAVLAGDAAELGRELGKLPAGTEVPLLRALGRRLLLLAKYRGEIDRGSGPGTVMASAGKSLFYKDKPAVERQLRRWNSAHLASAASRVLRSEEALKRPGGIGGDAVAESLYIIARAAGRLS